MDVLIVGGTGLISTAITQRLLDRGDRVTHFNRGTTEARYEGQVRHITGDRRQTEAFEALVRDAGPFDCVIDMICFRPEQAESLARACRGVAKQVIFCSTVDVYDKPAQRYPIREDAPLGGVSAYGQNKARCEALLMDSHRRDDFAVTVVRPAHSYGEGRGMIHVFGGGEGACKRLRQGKPVIVHGDGTSFWVSCHVDDVARAFAGAAGNERAYGKAYTAAGDEWQTWDRYTELLAEALGAPPPQIVHIPTDLLARALPRRAQVIAQNFGFNGFYDTSAARADLGFRQTISFLEGVRRTVAWCDARNLIDASDGDAWQDEVIAAWQRLTDQFVAEFSSEASEARVETRPR
jgi:nucleoside-diphosphate-sugar epimerase